jgi:hypothetical protein
MATKAQITTRDGYIIRAFSSMYLDYGLEITAPNGEEFYSPSTLSSESYGHKMCDHCSENGGEYFDCENHVEWTEDEWASFLHYEADDFIEAFMPID